MAEKKIDNAKGRWKLPWLDFHIVRTSELRALDRKIDVLEKEFKKQLWLSKVSAKGYEKLLHQIAVMTGRLKAPECPKCGKPKTAGGIQWLDHAECFAQGKSKKGKGKI